MGGSWVPVETERLENNCESWCTALLHIVPAKVAGTWQFQGGELALSQEFQMLQGSLKSGTRISSPVSSVASLVTPPLAVSPRTPGSV